LWFWRSVCNTGPLIKSALFHETIDFPRKKIYLAAKNVQKNRTTKKSWTKMHFSPFFYSKHGSRGSSTSAWSWTFPVLFDLGRTTDTLPCRDHACM
jgi:hypothetical protein